MSIGRRTLRQLKSLGAGAALAALAVAPRPAHAEAAAPTSLDAATAALVTPFGGDGHWPFRCGTVDAQGRKITFELTPDEATGGLAITIRRPLHVPITTPVSISPSPDERYLVLAARAPIVATPYEHQFYALLRADATQAHYDLHTAWRGSEDDVEELTPLSCR
jgi:hypothetical protein